MPVSERIGVVKTKNGRCVADDRWASQLGVTVSPMHLAAELKDGGGSRLASKWSRGVCLPPS